MSPVFPLNAHPCSIGEDTQLHGVPEAGAQKTFCGKKVTARDMQATGRTAVCPTCAAHQSGLRKALDQIAG